MTAIHRCTADKGGAGRRGRGAALGFLLALALTLGWLALLGRAAGAWRAPAATPTVRYVAPGGNCGGASPCYASLQAAVDAAADGETIKVAAGTYTGTRTLTSTVTGYTYTQIVLVDGKSLTIQGGFRPGDWTTYDPVANPVFLDARGYGRGVTVLGSGTQVVTLTGLQILNGDYTNLGNPPGVANAACPSTGGDCAGGLLAYRVRLVLKDVAIRNNTASRLRPYSDAGGALLWGTLPGSLLENVQVFSNTNVNEGYGGGVVIHYAGSVTLRRCAFDFNHSTFDGGGLLLRSVSGSTVVEGCRFVGNSAVGRTDARGGGIVALALSDLLLRDVEFRGNRASQNGAALFVRQVGSGQVVVTLTNVLAMENRVLGGPYETGAAVGFRVGTLGGLRVRLLQATLADNRAPAAVWFGQPPASGVAMTATLTNTLIASATYGIVGAHYTRTLAIRQRNSLFFNVVTPTAAEVGTPTFQAVGTVTGDPRLDANGRLRAGSAAIDAGVDSGVTRDLDGAARPAGAGYDIGADEYVAGAVGAFRFSQATYAVGEGRAVTVTVERIGGASGAVSVAYATADGTARAGQDYAAVSGTLAFADGEVRKSFLLSTLPDTRVESDETVLLRLSAPSGGAALGTPAQATLLIQDDDVGAAGEIRFLQPLYLVPEAAGKVVIPVVRARGSAGAVTVRYATGDGTARAGQDYGAASGTLTFADGETQRFLEIALVQDAVTEGTETFFVVLTNPTGGAVLGSPSQVTVEISDGGWRLLLPLVVR